MIGIFEGLAPGRRGMVLAVAAMGVVAACSPTPTTTDLMEADRAFARAVADQGTDAWVAAFAQDGMMFDGAEPVVGHDAIRGYMGPAFDSGMFTLTWEPLDARIASSGDLGYTRGRWESRSLTPDGSEVTGSGTYVTIWQLDSEGTWRVVLDIGAPDEPSDSEEP